MTATGRGRPGLAGPSLLGAPPQAAADPGGEPGGGAGPDGDRPRAESPRRAFSCKTPGRFREIRIRAASIGSVRDRRGIRRPVGGVGAGASGTKAASAPSGADAAIVPLATDVAPSPDAPASPRTASRAVATIISPSIPRGPGRLGRVGVKWALNLIAYGED